MGKISFLILLTLAVVRLDGAGYANDPGNRFGENAFPRVIISRTFVIPLQSGSLMVVCPASMEGKIGGLRLRLREKTGRDIPIAVADRISSGDLAGRHLILVGNISNNRWLLDLYRRRHAFADARFPGTGGVIIHPATSLWDGKMNALVIGVSRDQDLEAGLDRFLGLIKPGAKELPALHYLKTDVAMPTPPESVESVLDYERSLTSPRDLYSNIGNWGLLYFLTGDKRWASHFRDGFRLCLERGRRNGRWIPEPWTMMYFCLWNMFHAWELIDDDPFFTAADRKTVEEVLWGYTQFALGRPYLGEKFLPSGEPRQNHSTFLALSLFYAHRYYTEKYGMTGLEQWTAGFRRCFDDGQAMTYRPNDDGGHGYQVLAPGHYLNYALARGDESFFDSGRMRRLVDLMAATIDNRGDPVTFGDIGGYSHWQPGDKQSEEAKFFSLAAWKYRDGEYLWLANWLSRGRSPGIDAWGPIATGAYAVDLEEKTPSRFLGVRPVLLDEPSLRWSARRSENRTQTPEEGKKYVDKLAFRRSFDPLDEYLLLDGTSFFAHGHLDGNTVTRLSWKDRIWLFDLHYIKDSPREHNGVVVVRDGVQDAPPQLTSLDVKADFATIGVTRTTSRNYNGADWQRHVVWKKGRYFLFLDRLIAVDEGSFRFENRWRTRGDCRSSGDRLSVRQGEVVFHIQSADDAPRRIIEEADEPLGRWDYPYGDGKTSVWLGRKKIVLPRSGCWTFANMMFAAEPSETRDLELRRLGNGEYRVRDGSLSERIGLDSSLLRRHGVESDCSVFIEEDSRLFLAGASRLDLGDSHFASSRPVNVAVDPTESGGTIEVGEGGPVSVEVLNLTIDGTGQGPVAGKTARINLGEGTHRFRCARFPRWEQQRSVSTPDGTRRICSAPTSRPPLDFGIAPVAQHPVAERVTAVCADGDRLLVGDATGRIHRADEDGVHPLFQIPGRSPVQVLAVADVDADGRREIFAADDRENLHCHDSQGALRWTRKLTKYNGPDANVTDIAVGPLDATGKPAVLAATNGWKLASLTPDGRISWESFIRYHPSTRVRIFGEEKKQRIIAVGTVYQTPLNVLTADGEVKWFTWEQTGSESMSATEYCDKHLTDMVFVDTDLDGKGEIVFGTESSSIYALAAEDGALKWKALVGDAVTALRTVHRPDSGDVRILASTSGGELVKFSRAGERIAWLDLESGITGLEVVSHPASKREDIVVSTEEGGVFVVDPDLKRIRAAYRPETPGPAIGLVPAGNTETEIRFYVAYPHRISVFRYRPFSLRPSRHY